MTNEPLLPLHLTPDTDGNLCLLLDNSSLETFHACNRAFEYSWLRKRISAREKPALNFGRAMHEAFKWRYTTLGHQEPTVEHTKAMQQILDSHFDANPQPQGEYRTPTLAKNLVELYNKVYKKEQFEVLQHDGKPQIEVAFAHYVGEIRQYPPDIGLKPIKCYLTGRLDMAVRDAMGIWVIDHKTAFRFGEEFWNDQRMLWQCKGYVWAYRESYGEKPVGYIIDAIRTTRPKKGDEFNAETIEDDAGAVVKRQDLKRDFFPVSEAELDEWKQHFLLACEEVLYWHARGIYPMTGKHAKQCQAKYGRCQFCDVCMLPQHARMEMLMSGEYEDNVWSPLNPTNKEKDKE